ncbi:hypothetical protein R1sor_002848 [Riccia sorocarpa]|uniref:Uncharacterized protein n=1 Tax=Riccia sorocarpa TaxID=122646 RepID=A0ABD3H222_9MARC
MALFMSIRPSSSVGFSLQNSISEASRQRLVQPQQQNAKVLCGFGGRYRRRWRLAATRCLDSPVVSLSTGQLCHEDNGGSPDGPKSVKGKGFGPPRSVAEKKKSSPSAPSSNIRRDPPQKPLLAAQVDEETKQFETGIVLALAFIFSLIILEGVALAASGFLPEEWDEFLLKVIYPIFTPTVGVFLAGAAGYGVWKFFGFDQNKGPTSK